MKSCFKCGQVKLLTDFYTHKRMKDGHLNKCKECTKKDVSERYKVLAQNEYWVESERKRGRTKYRRLYVGKTVSSDTRKKRTANYIKNYPEKYKAHIKCQRMGKISGYHLHHWSYRDEYQTDVIQMEVEAHYLLHRHIKYDPTSKFYRTNSGELLDSKEKHLHFIHSTIGMRCNGMPVIHR